MACRITLENVKLRDVVTESMGGEEHSEASTTLDERLRMLSNASRRRLLRELLGRDEVHETELPAVLGEDDVDLKMVVVQMYHHHLPMLVEKDLVEWSPEEGVVRRGPAFDSLRPLLEWLGSRADGPVDGTDTDRRE